MKRRDIEAAVPLIESVGDQSRYPHILEGMIGTCIKVENLLDGDYEKSTERKPVSGIFLPTVCAVVVLLPQKMGAIGTIGIFRLTFIHDI